jgi:hypothetical protein
MKKFTRYWQWVFMGGIALAILFMTSGCAMDDSGDTSTSSGSTSRPGGIWTKISGAPRNYGPYTYVTQDSILLPDGTQVVCVSTPDDLWCKEVETQ